MKNISSEWQLQEAKNKLSHLVKEADKGVPQFITVHGKSKAVIISASEYQKLKQPDSSLSSALLQPILEEEGNLFARNPDTGRAIDL